jgi:hypothetical protein
MFTPNIALILTWNPFVDPSVPWRPIREETDILSPCVATHSDTGRVDYGQE